MFTIPRLTRLWSPENEAMRRVFALLGLLHFLCLRWERWCLSLCSRVHTKVTKAVEPVVTYVIKLPMYSKKRRVSY